MRQLVQLDQELMAAKLTAWLRVNGVDAFAEEDKSGFVVWIRDEDAIAEARKLAAEFQSNPNDPRYAAAIKQAEEQIIAEQKRLEQQVRNTIRPGDNWRRSGGGVNLGSVPLVTAILAISVVLGLMGGVFSKPDVTKAPYRWLNIVDVVALDERANVLGEQIENEPDYRTADIETKRSELLRRLGNPVWFSVLAGEYWRLLTPILMHFGITHLLFNGICFFQIGGQIERRQGLWFLLLLVLLTGLVSNIGQAAWGSMMFGGLSGVVYAAFGYVWISSRYNPMSGYVMDPGNVFIIMLWFFLCLAGEIPALSSSVGAMTGRIANVAHVVGLLSGFAMAAVEILRQRIR